MVDIAGLLTDLAAETADLDALVAPLTREQWLTPTPAEGWDIETSIAHLMNSDRAALVSLDGGDLMATVEGVLLPSYDGEDLLGEWRASAAELHRRLATLPAGARVTWYGPSMSQSSFVTARIMETWAHGQDVADALGMKRVPTSRLRHIGEMGFRTRGWAYLLRGRTPPAVEISVTLTAPDGGAWSWGEPEAEQTVTGTAEDFALLVTQRRHRDDLGLVATGPAAREWLTIAQAFAGGPTDGRAALASRK